MRDPDAPELRAVAALVARGEPLQLVAPVLLVGNGERVVGVTSAERIRTFQTSTLAVAIALDGTHTVPVAGWGMGRYSGLGIIEIEVEVPRDRDVVPLSLAGVRATPDSRGAPAAAVAIVPADHGTIGWRRQLVPVHVDVDDGAGMNDLVTRIASPADVAHAELAFEGAPVFVWFPPDPALGRPGEVMAVAVVHPYRAQSVQPRATPVVGELVGLDDLGRALISSATPPFERPELAQIAGEIEDRDADKIWAARAPTDPAVSPEPAKATPEPAE